MNKTVIIYTILIVFTIGRVVFYCDGDVTCPQKSKGVSQSVVTSKIINLDIINRTKQRSILIAEKALYSPHSELSLGMIIGVDNLSRLPKFSSILRDTGTIHVVVVSGYNINLVFGFVIKLIGSPYKVKNVLLACLITLFYCFLSGFEPPVIRAWIMGSVIIFTKFYGTRADSFYTLVLAAIIILIINPSYLFSISFQLSFIATFSLVYFSDFVKCIFEKFIKYKSQILDDFYSSIAVQIMLWPYISYHFNSFNPLSPIINSLILWTVPIITVAGGVFLLIGFISESLGILLYRLLFIPLDIFVDITEFFSQIPSTLHFKVPLVFLAAYYVFIFGKSIINAFKK